MKFRVLASIAVLAAVIALVSLGPVPVAAQAQAAAKKPAGTKTWTPPRTPDGQPDLQGLWSFATITPLERPRELAGKQVFTDEEAAEYEKQAAQSINKDRRDEDASVEGFINGAPVTADLARAYNEFWWDRGTKVVGTRRTSLIVDPPDGRVPPLTLKAKNMAAARAAARRLTAAGPEDRPPSERCVHQQRTGPPIMSAGYNNNLELSQSAGYVVILTEQIHEARIIPLDGRPHLGANIRQWKGDSRGRWEGDTLVVDTINFNGKMNFQESGENLHLVERFRRVDADTLHYEYTVEDPESFTRPWTVQLPMTRTPGPMYEYACHEGNYGMPSTLRGARAIEKATEEAAKKGTR